MAEANEQGTKRLTIDLPDDLHEAFSTKCFLHKPRLRMNHVIIDLVRDWVGRPKGEQNGKGKGR